MLSGAGRFTTDLQAVARQMRGPLHEHPSLEELLSYLAGNTYPADASFLCEHLSLCSDCCLTLLEAAAFPDLDATSERSASEADVEAAWQKLLPHLPLTSKNFPPLHQPHTRTPIAYRLATHLAATLLIACLGLSGYAASLYRELYALKRPQSIPIVEMVASEDVRRGSEGIQSVHVPPYAKGFVLLLGFLDSHDYDRYRASFECGRRVLSIEDLQRNPDGDFTVEISRDSLPVGRCQIRLYGTREGRARQVASYEAEIAYE